MKAKELRIGNYVYCIDEHANYKEVQKIEWFPLTMLKYYHPIELNEEWLLNFGFLEEKDRKFIIEHDHTEYVLQIRTNLPKENGSCGFMGVKFRKESIPSYTSEGEETTFEQKESETYFAWNIKYVHQLQNLYFALTGQELTLK